MRARSVALVVVSLVTGFVLGTGFDWTVQARQLPKFDPNPPRMERIGAGPAGKGDSSTFTSFLKDTKSGACWLYVSRVDAISVAPAPAEACN